MDVTAQLLRVFLIEKQIRGLTERLRTAERFLDEQHRHLASLDASRASLEAQHRQWRASAANHEGEMKRLDERIAALRSQMNNAQTNKEYKAFLSEVNTLKTERDRVETLALEALARVEESQKALAEVDQQRAEREKLRGVATTDRDARAEEIRERLAELTEERARAVEGIAREPLRLFEQLLKTRGDEAMAPIEAQDRRRHEFNCGSCMMSLPVEAVSGLMSKGKLTTCVSCGCILYLDKELSDAMTQAVSGKK